MDQRLTQTTPEAGTDASRGPFVRRFEPPTRIVHWVLAAPFLLLLLTGLTNFQPELKAQQVGDVRIFAWLHVVLGFASVGAIVLVVLPLLGRRSARADLGALARTGLDDYLWLQHTAIQLVGGRSRAPRVGKFNAGQKLNAVASLLATAALMGTGVILGINYVTKEVFSARFVEDVFPWHTAVSLLFIPLLLGHLYLALVHPSTRESLRGIALGVVRREWARRHHDAWLEGIEEAEAASTRRDDGGS